MLMENVKHNIFNETNKYKSSTDNMGKNRILEDLTVNTLFGA